MSHVGQNIKIVRENIKNVCEKIGRNPEEITVIAVSKMVEPEYINEAVKLGFINLGENWVQEIRQKYSAIDKSAKWNMIGHLQTNKVKYIIDKVNMIQSVDSIKLADEISKRASNADVLMPILIQVNVAEESQKFGTDVKGLDEFLVKVSKLPGLKIKGLMLIAPYVTDKEEIRPVFRQMKSIYDDVKNKNYDNIDMQYLSMGMSGDYEIAIEEGSNMVRIGSAIFGERVY